jgi:hypothetical protein
MSRPNRLLLAVALFALASFARADALRLLAPAAGTTLRGGSFAELHWSAAHLPEGAEEWEAFLSIDGGKYYAFRVTPHLDIELRRFTFIVPNVDTRDARILIRTGNEVRETHFEARGAFSIVRDPNTEEIISRLLFGHGEAAREGDPAVLSWTDGARNGSGVTQRFSSTLPAPAVGWHSSVTSDESAALAPPESSVEALSIASMERSSRDIQTRKAEPVPIPIDLLLVCRRRNI